MLNNLKKGFPGRITPVISPDEDELSRAAASHVALVAEQAVKKRGIFFVALSGGSVIKIVGNGLKSLQISAVADWLSWNVFWADERVVPPESRDSNYIAASEDFLRFVPIPAGQVFPVDTSAGALEGAKRYASTLSRIMKADGAPPRFDLILLGIGEDGHTASLFPGRRALEEKKEWIVPVFDSPKPPPERVTMTLPVINSARHIVFIAKGPGKAPVISDLFGNNKRRETFPVEMVRPYEGELRCFFDSAAASGLDITKGKDLE